MNIMINNKKQKEKNCRCIICIPTFNFNAYILGNMNKCNDNDTICNIDLRSCVLFKDLGQLLPNFIVH